MKIRQFWKTLPTYNYMGGPWASRLH